MAGGRRGASLSLLTGHYFESIGDTIMQQPGRARRTVRRDTQPTP